MLNAVRAVSEAKEDSLGQSTAVSLVSNMMDDICDEDRICCRNCCSTFQVSQSVSGNVSHSRPCHDLLSLAGAAALVPHDGISAGLSVVPQ